jgi:hypothetical protein
VDPDDYADRDNILEDLKELQAPAEGGDLSVRLVETAVLPGDTVETPTSVIAAASVLAGLFLGIVAALLLEWLRASVGRRGDRGASEWRQRQTPEPAQGSNVLPTARESSR